MIHFKVRLAIRNLLKDKINSTLIIGGFAISFTAIILIGLFYVSEKSVNTIYSNSENIYRIYDTKNNKLNLDYKLFPVLLEEYSEIEDVCPMEYVGGFSITIKDSEQDMNLQIDQILTTTGNFFDIFSIETISSLSRKPFATDKSIVITESVAKKMYGSVNPLGRVLKTDFFEGTISAIIKDLPKASSFNAEIILNTDNKKFRLSETCDDGKCWFTTQHFMVLNEKANVEALTSKINKNLNNLNSNTGSIAFQNIGEIYLSTLQIKDSHLKGNNKMLSIFMFIGVLIILLASINYLNFTISKQFNKFKEIGINKTSGANTMNLFSASMIEVSIGIAISVIISILLAALIFPHAQILFGKSIQLNNLNIKLVLPIFVTLIVFVVLINSIAPVYVISKFKITDYLSGKGKTGKGQVGKQVMLSFQMIASITLITLVLFIFKQLNYVKHHDLGFDEDHLVRIELPYFYESPSTIKEEIGKLPFVAGSTLSDGYPGHIRLRMGSGEKGKEFSVNCIHISDDYLETMGMSLVDGREFHLGDENKTCLLNAEAMKRFGWISIENKKYNQNKGYNVVGVVENFNVESLHSLIEPVALLYTPDHKFNSLSVRLLPGDLNQQLKAIEKVWEGILPNEPMYLSFYDQQFQALYEKEERLAKSISFFSIIAIVLTCMGILGQILFICFARMKEIGIRKVNGAKISEILSMLNKDFIVWTIVAFVISCPITYYVMSLWLENFAYKTELNWWIFAIAGLIALLIAIVTISWQSWRAATRNPVEVLRYE